MLSTTVSIPCLFAIVVIASISATSILGFVNDSKNITFVFSSISASIESGLCTSKNLASMPNLLNV